MSDIKSNLSKILATLPAHCKLIAVSKTKPVELIQQVYDAGQTRFGENKVQEMTEKVGQLPADAQWHLIGHLQTNKVKYIASFVSMIHSVDSLKLLQEIDKRAEQNNRVIDCLFQMHIAEEETKFGLSESELMEILEGDVLPTLRHVRIKGLMGMATFTDNNAQIRKEFRGLKRVFENVKNAKSGTNLDFTELSMGMSSDYPIAVEEGSTMVRVGSAIFGGRV